jgi:hypothetical protein
LMCKPLSQTFDPAVIAALDADYYIDYTGGTIPIGDLPIGARVVDPSWEWEFRTGDNYSGSGAVKPVTWIAVAKDHYDGLQPHVTLLAEELIGKHAFDDSTNRGSRYGLNHWGDSGINNASRGLRPWLNSSGIHSGEGFYRAFSESFKGGSYSPQACRTGCGKTAAPTALAISFSSLLLRNMEIVPVSTLIRLALFTPTSRDRVMRKGLPESAAKPGIIGRVLPMRM